jgi:DNA-binding transcriptional MerR regulator
MDPLAAVSLGPKRSTSSARVRVTDLARSVGLSVQQIRNYIEAGMLPPTGRSENGYRIFTARHADALVVARIVLDGYGWTAATHAMRAAHDGDRAAAAVTADACHAALDRERADVTGLLRAFDGDLPAELQISHPLLIGDVAAIARVRPSALRVWERLGLLSPERDPATGYRSYDQAQLIRARVIALLRASGWSVAAAKDVMDAMRDGDPARTRTALRSRLAELDRLSWKRMRATAALCNYVEAVGPPVQ